MFKSFRLAAILGAGILLAAGAAQATPVPAGTLKLQDFNVDVDNTGYTITLGTPMTVGGGKGAFISSSGNATVYSNPFSFIPTVGATVSYSGAAAITNFLVFTDGNGETYTFSLDQTLQTVSYNYNSSTGGTVNVYLLGDLTGTGTTTYSTLTQTALTLQLNETGTSGYSFAGTLANPPPGSGLPGNTLVPEPASMTLLGGGLAALGFIRRRRKH